VKLQNVRLAGLFLILATVLREPYLAWGDTWLVLEDGTGDAPTIDAAVDSTGPGDSVLVGAGSYFEQVNVGQKVGLTLTSINGPETTTINADGPGFAVRGFGVSELLLEGFTLTGAEGGYGFSGGVGFIGSGSATVVECIIPNAGPNSESAISFDGTLSVLDTTIRDGGGMAFVGPALLIERCRFERNRASGYPSVVQIWRPEKESNSHVRIRQSVFVENELQFGKCTGCPVIGYNDTFTQVANLVLEVEGNLFLRNAGSAVGPNELPVPLRGFGGGVDVVVRNNTIAASFGDGLGTMDIPFPDGTVIERNVVTGCLTGIRLSGDGLGVDLNCNLSWGNGMNWAGFPDPSGKNGNFSAPPRYCNPALDDFTVASNSPCLPGNNSCLELIGAFLDGCGPISVETTSWGRLKSLYR